VFHIELPMERLTPRTQEQIQKDANDRVKYEKRNKEKLDELHSIKDRLYQLRHDISRPETDIVRDVKNLANEYNRLEDDINRLRRKEQSNFEKSLELDSLGISGIITKAKLQSSIDREASSSSIPVTEEVIITALPSAYSPIEEHEPMTMIPENEKLMRTGSTQSMKNLSAEQKWKGLFKMFKEWNYQTKVGAASRIVTTGNNGSVQDEIIKLRAALYQLRQRKNLTESDKLLMEQMAVKLKGLMKIQSELSGMELNQRRSYAGPPTSST